MESTEFALLYPRFLVVDRGVFPDVRLPRNFRELVPLFYADKGRERIEAYTTQLQQLVETAHGSIDLRLNWHERDGLRNISVGTHGGLDLEESPTPHYAEHNLGWTNGFYAAFIAIEYVRELLKR